MDVEGAWVEAMGRAERRREDVGEGGVGEDGSEEDGSGDKTAETKGASSSGDNPAVRRMPPTASETHP